VGGVNNAVRILISLAVGLLLGIAGAGHLPEASAVGAQIAGPVGTLWLNALRMTIVPLVVALLIVGVARTAQAARAGRIAGLSLGWITAVMLASAMLGAVLTPLLLDLWPMPPASAAALREALGVSAPVAPVAPVPPFADFLAAIVPTNPVQAAASDAILPLLIFTGVFAFALTRLPRAPRTLLTDVFAAIGDALLIVIDWVLRLAPIGVFALAFVVGARAGAAAFGALLHYILLVGAVGLVICLCAYGVAAIGGRVALRAYAREIVPVQAIAISTQSSLACLPMMLRKSRALGVGEATADLVLPMAVALMRATGPAMNLAVALYVAHWFGVAQGPGHYAVAVIVAALTSMGSVSLPGQVSFITAIAPICLAIGVPVEPLALLIAVETLPDIVRTLGNAMMDVSVATAVDRAGRGAAGTAERADPAG
jgi:Na+/H+-dicarboxylate symporter